MIGVALLPQAQDGSPSTAARLCKGTGLAKLGAMWREGASAFSKNKSNRENARQVKQDVPMLLGLLVEIVNVHGVGTRRSCDSCESLSR